MSLKELGDRFCLMPISLDQTTLYSLKSLKKINKEVNSTRTSRLVWSHSGSANLHSKAQFKVRGTLTNLHASTWHVSHVHEAHATYFTLQGGIHMGVVLL